VLFALGIPVCAQTPPAPASGLKDAAKEPLQKGLAAAQQQDWKLAIRYFLEAQKADPDAPQIWFNLGLASSKLPGYELRALAWFQAYLLAVPDAPNTDAIRQQIATLEVAFESRMGKIIDALETIPPMLLAQGRNAVNQSKPGQLPPEIQDTVMNLAKVLATARSFLGDPTSLLNLSPLAMATTGRGDWDCALAEVQPPSQVPAVDAFFAATGRLPVPADRIPLEGGCSQDIGYFLEAGDFGGAQHYAGSEFPYITSTRWEGIVCEAFNRHDQKALRDALAKAEGVLDHRDDRERISEFDLHNDRFRLGLLLVAVGERDTARKLAVDSFNERREDLDVVQDLVGLLVAVGENSRADAFNKSFANAFRSGQRVLPDPCTKKGFWWGRDRRDYLIDAAIHGVAFQRCVFRENGTQCSDSGDETQLAEILRESKDIAGGSNPFASAVLLTVIADDLAHLVEEYRRVHGPYRH
jgi:tetratricopeptide (TPR) repeat protein